MLIICWDFDGTLITSGNIYKDIFFDYVKKDFYSRYKDLTGYSKQVVEESIEESFDDTDDEFVKNESYDPSINKSDLNDNYEN